MTLYVVLSVLLLGEPQSSPSLDTYLNRARTSLADGSVNDAVSLLHEATRTYPASADAHVLLGSALALVPRRDEAISELTRAIELAPTSAPFHNTLGMALAQFAEYDQARTEFEKTIK